MKKILIIGLIILSLFSSLAKSIFGQEKPHKDGDALLYKISGKDLKKPSYLYGTIHRICQSDMFGMEKLTGYVDESHRVLLEFDLDDPAALAEMAVALNMADGKTINDLLTQEQFKKLDDTFKKYLGVSAELVKRIIPMGLTLMLATSPKLMGCANAGSYDLAFSQMAVKSKKPVEGLETVTDQMGAISKIPLEKQAEALNKFLLEPEKNSEEFKKLVASYKLQDSEKLFSEMQIWLKDDPNFEESLLTKRNLNWIPKIEKAIASESIFIAVGAGHLGGKNGVVKLLREKGYRLEAVKL